MKKLFSLLALCGLGLFAFGCGGPTAENPAGGDTAVIETEGAVVEAEDGATGETEGAVVEAEGTESAPATEGDAPATSEGDAPATEGTEPAPPAEGDAPADE